MTIKEIKKFIETKTELDLTSKTRKTNIVFVRYLCYYCAFHYGDDCYGEESIAKLFGFDRITVYHGINEFENILRSTKWVQVLLSEVQPVFKQERAKINYTLEDLEKRKLIIKINNLIKSNSKKSKEITRLNKKLKWFNLDKV